MYFCQQRLEKAKHLMEKIENKEFDNCYLNAKMERK